MTQNEQQPREVVGPPTSAEYTPPEPPKKATKATETNQEAEPSTDEPR
jgi:hypothetical protein